LRVTTYTLNGFLIQYDQAGDVARIAEDTLTVYTSDGFRAAYSLVDPASNGEFSEILLQAANGELFDTRVGDLPPIREVFAYAGTIVWGTANARAELMTLNFAAGDSYYEFFLRVDGTPLPIAGTMPQFYGWRASISEIHPGIDALAPDSPFRLQDLPTFASVTEDDLFIAWRDGDDPWHAVYLDTGIGHDHVQGSGIADRVQLGSGNDTGRGLAGNDTLNGQSGRDWLTGGSGADLLTGGRGQDVLMGGTGHDVLSGHSGRDTMEGGSGRDRLWGGAEADSLAGGAGADRLTGGAGADTFDYQPGGGADRITDFADNIDTLALARAFGLGDATAVRGIARTITGGVRLDFGDGDILTVMGVTRAQILDDILIL
jgi:hypothetical protein